jgi:hypothetical protein
MPTQEVVKLLGFMEEIRMPLGVALIHEEPPRDPSFEYRWPFQLGKPLVKPELVLKLSPKIRGGYRAGSARYRLSSLWLGSLRIGLLWLVKIPS